MGRRRCCCCNCTAFTLRDGNTIYSLVADVTDGTPNKWESSSSSVVLTRSGCNWTLKINGSTCTKYYCGCATSFLIGSYILTCGTPCLYVCFKRAANTDGTDCPVDDEPCVPRFGIEVTLCWSTKTNQYEGQSTFPAMKVILSENDGDWSISYGCPDASTSVPLEVTSEAPFGASADSQPNGGCGDGCVDIIVSDRYVNCPSIIKCPPEPFCDCPANSLPEEVLVTLPGLANARHKGDCPCSDCGSFAGQYFLSYSGVAAGWAASWSAWIGGHCGHPDDQDEDGYCASIPCKFHSGDLGPNFAGCTPCEPQTHACGNGVVYDCPYGFENPMGPASALLIYYRGCSAAMLVLYQFAADCYGNPSGLAGTQVWLSYPGDPFDFGEAAVIDPNKPCCGQIGATLDWYGQDTGFGDKNPGVEEPTTFVSTWCLGAGTSAVVAPVVVPSCEQ